MRSLQRIIHLMLRVGLGLSSISALADTGTPPGKAPSLSSRKSSRRSTPAVGSRKPSLPPKKTPKTPTTKVNTVKPMTTATLDPWRKSGISYFASRLLCRACAARSDCEDRKWPRWPLLCSTQRRLSRGLAACRVLADLLPGHWSLR